MAPFPLQSKSIFHTFQIFVFSCNGNTDSGQKLKLNDIVWHKKSKLLKYFWPAKNNPKMAFSSHLGMPFFKISPFGPNDGGPSRRHWVREKLSHIYILKSSKLWYVKRSLCNFGLYVPFSFLILFNEFLKIWAIFSACPLTWCKMVWCCSYLLYSILLKTLLKFETVKQTAVVRHNSLG